MRLLVVAAPMVSRGGLYSWLTDTTPILREAGWTIGLVWAVRVAADPPHADWQRRLDEQSSRIGRVRALPRAVGDAIDAFGPERVLSLLPQSDLACARLTGRRGVPWTAMVHGQPYPAEGEAPAGRRRAWRAAVAWAYGRADQVVTVSDALRETLRLDLGVQRAVTVHNGVHLPPEAALRPREGRTVGFLGRLSVEKAPDLFVEAVRPVACDARVYGDGPLTGAVRAAASGLDHVTLEGWTDRDAALAAIDLLVLTSRREALGLSCIEAGARGVPVLARDIDGVREVLGQDPELRKHCILPTDAPPSAFGERLATLLDDVALRRRLGRRLREVVATRFALPAQALQLAHVLKARA